MSVCEHNRFSQTLNFTISFIICQLNPMFAFKLLAKLLIFFLFAKFWVNYFFITFLEITLK